MIKMPIYSQTKYWIQLEENTSKNVSERSREPSHREQKFSFNEMACQGWLETRRQGSVDIHNFSSCMGDTKLLPFEL